MLKCQLPLTNHVSLGKQADLSEHQFSYFEKELIVSNVFSEG